MLSPKTLKAYWQSVADRVSEITSVTSVTRIDEISKLLKDANFNDVILVCVIPSFDTESPDRDNIIDKADHIIFVLKIGDRKDDSESYRLDLYDETMLYLKAIRTIIDNDKRICNSIARRMDTSSTHFDPEQFEMAFGWSASIGIKDDDIFLNSSDYEISSEGIMIVPGPNGKSAYQVWLENGHTGSEADFLASLKGADGYTPEKGVDYSDGANGKSAYQIWLENGHTVSEADFLESLKGADGYTPEKGVDYSDGANGKSAYQIWLESGHTGSEADFLESLKGADGYTPEKGVDYSDGANGKSAYQIWLENGHTGSEADFLASLKGEKGDPKDAYCPFFVQMPNYATLTANAAIYFGNNAKAATTSTGRNKIYIRHSGTITCAELYSYAATTAGTGENISLYIRLTNGSGTTDYLVKTVGSANAERIFSNTGLNIAVVAGDYFEMKLVTPTSFSTAPQGVTIAGNIYLKY